MFAAFLLSALPLVAVLVAVLSTEGNRIEEGSDFFRALYYGGLEMVHDEAVELQHQFFEYVTETGAVHVIVWLCVSYIAVAALSWFVNRFTEITARQS